MFFCEFVFDLFVIFGIVVVGYDVVVVVVCCGYFCGWCVLWYYDCCWNVEDVC